MCNQSTGMGVESMVSVSKQSSGRPQELCLVSDRCFMARSVDLSNPVTSKLLISNYIFTGTLFLKLVVYVPITLKGVPILPLHMILR
jgi:hypothetical protein